MANPQARASQNWFERNSKKTVFGFVLLLILAATYGSEKLLAYINHHHNLVVFNERRYINLH